VFPRIHFILQELTLARTPVTGDANQAPIVLAVILDQVPQDVVEYIVTIASNPSKTPLPPLAVSLKECVEGNCFLYPLFCIQNHGKMFSLRILYQPFYS
jgi:hypothetical protein